MFCLMPLSSDLLNFKISVPLKKNNRSLRRLDQPANTVGQGGFSAPRFTDDTDGFTAKYPQIEVIDDPYGLPFPGKKTPVHKVIYC